ncbi:hypothetical protein EIP86_011179 [Pleurotus ostreatoroseus]|nr:hypothetical protein EIP86_011179 [Pleurotus ostreatoroseus]
MASTTKAGKIWQLLHQNDDFASTILLGVSRDDTDKVQSALDIVNVGSGDLNLTEQELADFFRGVTASGALELTSWEGYYVTEPLPGSGDKYALLIFSFNNTVYWGLESQLIQDFKSFAVSYQLPKDGTLRFPTASGNAVFTFSRTYDIEKGKAGLGSIKGTLGGTAISGSQTQSLPPWSKTGTQSTKATPPVEAVFLRSPEDSASAEPSPFWFSDAVGGNFLAVAGILGGITAAVQVYLWIRKLWLKQSRKQVSEELTAVLTHEQSLALAVASAKVGEPDVDWSSTGTELTNAVEQQLNEALRKMGVDFAHVDAETVVKDLRETTRNALRVELEKHAVRAVTKTVLDRSDAFKALPNHFQWATDLARTIGMDRARQKYDSFGHGASPSVFDSLGRSVVSKARSEFFHEHWSAAVAAATRADKEASDVTASREVTQKALRELDREIEQDKESNHKDRLLNDQHRREELETRLKQEEAAQQDKRREAEEHQRQAKTSKEQADKSEGEAKHAREAFHELLQGHGK